MTEIDILSEGKDLQEYWQMRDAQMLLDRNIVNLVKPVAKAGKIQWVSNEPKVFYETAKAFVSSYPARFRMPLTINYSPEEKERMNKTERFGLGIFRSLDKRERDKGDPNSYWMRGLAHWVLSGWYAIFTRVRKVGGEVDFIADFFDPINVYPKWDSDKLVRCIRSFDVDRQTAEGLATGWARQGAKFEFKPDKEQQTFKVVNYWMDDSGIDKNGRKTQKVYNAIMLDDTVIKDIKLEPFKRIPIFIGAIGSPEKTSADWPTRMGEHVIAANRDMYEYENYMASLMATIMSSMAFPNIISKTLSGAPAIKQKSMKGYAEVISLRIGETVEAFKAATTPAEANLLMNWVGQKKQKGSIPDIVYGGVPFELSGFAISQLMAAIRYKLAPYLATMRHVTSDVLTELLGQYRDGKYPKISLVTTNPRDLRKGEFFVEEYDASDIPKSLYVEVSIPVTSAMDKMQQMLYARQAMSPPQLLSRETLWDDPEILDVQDSEQEYARIIQDEMLEQPIIKQIAMVEQLRIREQGYRAQGKIAEADALHRYILALEMQLGMRQAIPQTPGVPGTPSQVMPSEATGASPDRLGATLGVAPPGVGRGTPNEQAVRGGGLVSPTGRSL